MSILEKTIQTVQESELSFCKFITANDAGSTGSHQSGFHIPKNSWRLFFNKEGNKGENKDLFVTIKWQDDFETKSRFIYYGTGTRNEYRLTRFGRGFPFLAEGNIGSLLILCKKSTDYYQGFVLQADEDIDDFFAELNISATETNRLITQQFEKNPEDDLNNCFLNFLSSIEIDFPPTSDIATAARKCYNQAFKVTEKIVLDNPDKSILNWLIAEFQLFKTIENIRYSEIIKTPFKTVEHLVETANTILNRRKSRAGKSLEHHLNEIFKTFKLAFETQAITEDHKKPDFLFPNAKAYFNTHFDEKKLIFLASKTTCKDRWRQILNEADRIKIKYLMTLQQGISTNQLIEMKKNGVILVVPEPHKESFPKETRADLLSLNQFIQIVKKTQS